MKIASREDGTTNRRGGGPVWPRLEEPGNLMATFFSFVLNGRFAADTYQHHGHASTDCNCFLPKNVVVRLTSENMH